jgi:hypoxanthine-DNA glycosylase
MIVEGLSLLGDTRAKILILGSMPSVRSVDQQEYYAHPQNVFWKIIKTLFNTECAIHYEQKQELLMCHSIALWDVLKLCERQGSLDANIKKDTIEINDFVSLFSQFPNLTHVFFNGLMAESVYKKHVLPLIFELYPSIAYARLPSTSPAYAAMKYEHKLKNWTLIKSAVEV